MGHDYDKEVIIKNHKLKVTCDMNDIDKVWAFIRSIDWKVDILTENNGKFVVVYMSNISQKNVALGREILKNSCLVE